MSSVALFSRRRFAPLVHRRTATNQDRSVNGGGYAIGGSAHSPRRRCTEPSQFALVKL